MRKWWNDSNIEIVTIDKKEYALNGWNGSSYTDSWETVEGTAVGTYDIKPIYEPEELDDDGEPTGWEIVSYEIREGIA